MNKKPVIAIFDIGKTNKKLLVFNAEYGVEEVRFHQLPTTNQSGTDEHPSEDAFAIRNWIEEESRRIAQEQKYQLRAINFTTYGATVVHIGQDNSPLSPVLNYFCPFDAGLQEEFIRKYSNAGKLSAETCSPILGNLNTGLQLYALRKENPQLFSRIKYSVHLPQYISGILSGSWTTEFTSLGCHTLLWNFRKNEYHDWVCREQLTEKLPPLTQAPPGNAEVAGKKVLIGYGLHDSSAALLPYLATVQEPFVLLSTGTWCVTLNSFNQAPLTREELDQDCLCYLTPAGRQVKASRFDAGRIHQQMLKKIEQQYGQRISQQELGQWNVQLADLTLARAREINLGNVLDLNWKNAPEAYYAFMYALVVALVRKIRLIMTPDIKSLFIDGGFSNNLIFMNLLAIHFPDIERICSSELGQGTALGAALNIHSSWNNRSIPSSLISFRQHSI